MVLIKHMQSHVWLVAHLGQGRNFLPNVPQNLSTVYLYNADMFVILWQEMYPPPTVFDCFKLLQLASQSGYVTINWKKINKDMGKVSRNVTEKFEEYTSLREQQSEVSKYFKKVRDPSIFDSTLTKLLKDCYWKSQWKKKLQKRFHWGGNVVMNYKIKFLPVR